MVVATSNYLKISAGKVATNLADFVIRVDLAAMSVAWWGAVLPDGGNLRIRDSTTTTLVPVDVVSINTTLRTGEVFFKSSLSATVDNDFAVEINSDL